MRGYIISGEVCNKGFRTLCLFEGQPENLLTFSGQIDEKHYVLEKLTFLMVCCGVTFKLSDKKNKKKQRQKVFSDTYLKFYFCVSSLHPKILIIRFNFK